MKIPLVVVSALALVSFQKLLAAPAEVCALAEDMLSAQADVRAAHSKDLGVYIVGVGHSVLRNDSPRAQNSAREKAEAAAKNAIASFLGTKVESRTQLSVAETAHDGQSELKEFYSSLTKTSVREMLKGLQMLECRKMPEGEIVVVMYAASKVADANNDFENQQNAMGDKGIVRATGIDTDRRVAEQNALRSAVEQVAGTMVVGKVSVSEQEELHKCLATTAGALVEEYRVVQEVKIGVEYRIEVLAKVSKKKLYDSYRSFFKALDNPRFVVLSTNQALVRSFSQYFIDKGMDVTENPNDADYMIRLNGRFTDRPSPITGKPGTMLDLSVEVVSCDGGTVLLKMSEKKAKDSDVLTHEQRVESVAHAIFDKIHARLDQEIHKMVVKMLDDAV